MQKNYRWLKWCALGLVGLALAVLALAEWPARNIELSTPLPEQSGLSGELYSRLPLWLRVGRKTDAVLRVTTRSDFGASAPVLQAWLELPGAVVLPQGKWLQPLVVGQTVNFQFQIEPVGGNELDGTLWVAVLRGEQRQVILARPVQLSVRDWGIFTSKLLDLLAGGLLVVALLLAGIRWVICD